MAQELETSVEEDLPLLWKEVSMRVEVSGDFCTMYEVGLPLTYKHVASYLQSAFSISASMKVEALLCKSSAMRSSGFSCGFIHLF